MRDDCINCGDSVPDDNTLPVCNPCTEIAARRRQSEKRCIDCGERGETKGHMTCQYPQD